MYIYKLTTTFFFTLVKYEKIKKKLGFKVVITIERTHCILCNKKKDGIYNGLGLYYTN